MRTQHTLHPLPAFPVYSAGFVTPTRFVIGGGGGTARSGIRNRIRMYEVENGGTALNMVGETELEKGEDAPMTIAVNAEDGAVVCGANSNEESVKGGINEHCRLYRVKGDDISLERKKQLLPSSDLESYQNLTAFSRDFKLIAVGTTDNEVNVLSYPSLVPVAQPFKLSTGILYGLDFSEDTLLITTSTALHFISLPLILVATKETASSTSHSVTLPKLESTQTIEVPSISVLAASDDGAIKTFRAARFNPSDSTVLYAVVNSSPAAGRAGRGKKVERRAFLVRYQLSVPAAAEAKKTEDSISPAGTWAVKKVRNIGKRAVTVFTVSENGKLAAYGASDSSVCIVDSRTFAPQLEILKSHDFPPTLLQFNSPANLLISGSADASVRVIVVPGFSPASPSSLLYILLIILVAVLAVIAAILLQQS